MNPRNVTPPGADPVLMTVSDYGGKSLAFGRVIDDGDPGSAGYEEAFDACNKEWQKVADQVLALRASHERLKEALERIVAYDVPDAHAMLTIARAALKEAP